jgi:hypothetical protein
MNAKSHLVVVDLAEVIKIHAGDYAVQLVQIAFGVKIFAETDLNMLLHGKPLPLAVMQLLLAVHNSNLSKLIAFVLEQLPHPVIQFEIRADENQLLLGIFNQLRQLQVDCDGVEKQSHAAFSAVFLKSRFSTALLLCGPQHAEQLAAVAGIAADSEEKGQPGQLTCVCASFR